MTYNYDVNSDDSSSDSSEDDDYCDCCGLDTDDCTCEYDCYCKYH